MERVDRKLERSTGSPMQRHDPSTHVPSAETPSAVELLGYRIRRARLARSLGVRELARSADCSPSMISQIEKGISKPSVSTLYAISMALGASIDNLLSGVADAGGEPAPSPLARAPQERAATPRIVLHQHERRLINLERGVQWQLLMPAPEPSAEFMEVTYAPGGGSAAADHAIRHNGREYCLVLEGDLTVEIGFEHYTLGPGDSMAFDSTVPHRIWNPGATTVRAVWFVLGRLSG